MTEVLNLFLNSHPSIYIKMCTVLPKPPSLSSADTAQGGGSDLMLTALLTRYLGVNFNEGVK